MNETRLVRGKHSDEVYNAWRHSFALQLRGAQHASAPAPLPRRSSRSHLPASPRISSQLPNLPLPPSRPAAPLTISVPAGPVSECLIDVWRRLGLKVEPKERAADGLPHSMLMASLIPCRWSPKSEPRRLHARRSWAYASRVESHQLRLDSGGAKRPEPKFKPKRARATRRTDPKCKLLSSTAAQPHALSTELCTSEPNTRGGDGHEKKRKRSGLPVSRSRIFINHP